MHHSTTVARAAALACLLIAAAASTAHAQTAAPAPAAPASASAPAPETTLQTIVIRASADASRDGLQAPYAGGQVARGGRAGILGTQDNMSTPFSITAYTNELIQDRQARSVGEVLQNDAGVRTARGFGNFQESYFIRGFLLNSDDVAYNGLYSLLPRQYIATELFERVEVLRGASAFLSGANPGGGGIGGSVNLLPKRATNEPLTRVTLGASSGTQGTVALDLARRFGPDKSTGVRVNLAWRDGETAVDREKAKLGLASVGFDWRSSNVRLSADIGFQDNKLKATRPNVSLGFAVTAVPAAPDASSNFAQSWSYSNERDTFGTLRGEVDLGAGITAWGAYGLRRSEEANVLANLDVTANSGAGSTQRFDNTRKDKVDTGEVGLRGKLRAGGVGNEWVLSASWFGLEKKTAYVFDTLALPTNLYTPQLYSMPAYSPTIFTGGNLATPALSGRIRLSSLALGDTLSLLDDSLLITLGARQQKLFVADYNYGPDQTTRYDQTRTSPMAAVVFKFSKQLSAYGNYIEGLTQGESASAFLTPRPVNFGQSLAPYVSKQKEAGLKFDGGRLGGSLALFSTTKPRSLVNAQNVFTSEGEDKHQGVELNVFGEAQRGLRLLGGITWLDARQKTTGSASTDGKHVIGVPKLAANLGVEWELPMLRGLALDARVVRTGSSYADAANTLNVPGWTRLDIGARYIFDVQDKAVTLRARVDNVADKNDWASVGGYPGSGYLVVGSPRSFNLSASVDF